jgi:small subunit ribosomal protein S17
MANNRRRLVGRVVSDKMEKTVVVAVERRKMHRVYKKVVASTRKVMAHDESNEVPVGALVRIVESQPLSRRKRWVVEEVLETAEILPPASDADAQIEPDTDEEDETKTPEAVSAVDAEAETDEENGS